MRTVSVERMGIAIARHFPIYKNAFSRPNGQNDENIFEILARGVF